MENPNNTNILSQLLAKIHQMEINLEELADASIMLDKQMTEIKNPDLYKLKLFNKMLVTSSLDDYWKKKYHSLENNFKKLAQESGKKLVKVSGRNKYNSSLDHVSFNSTQSDSLSPENKKKNLDFELIYDSTYNKDVIPDDPKAFISKHGETAFVKKLFRATKLKNDSQVKIALEKLDPKLRNKISIQLLDIIDKSSEEDSNEKSRDVSSQNNGRHSSVPLITGLGKFRSTSPRSRSPRETTSPRGKSSPRKISPRSSNEHPFFRDVSKLKEEIKGLHLQKTHTKEELQEFVKSSLKTIQNASKFVNKFKVSLEKCYDIESKKEHVIVCLIFISDFFQVYEKNYQNLSTTENDD